MARLTPALMLRIENSGRARLLILSLGRMRFDLLEQT
jgi:hypothetical protein